MIFKHILYIEFGVNWNLALASVNLPYFQPKFSSLHHPTFHIMTPISLAILVRMKMVHHPLLLWPNIQKMSRLTFSLMFQIWKIVLVIQHLRYTKRILKIVFKGSLSKIRISEKEVSAIKVVNSKYIQTNLIIYFVNSNFILCLHVEFKVFRNWCKKQWIK